MCGGHAWLFFLIVFVYLPMCFCPFYFPMLASIFFCYETLLQSGLRTGPLQLGTQILLTMPGHPEGESNKHLHQSFSGRGEFSCFACLVV